MAPYLRLTAWSLLVILVSSGCRSGSRSRGRSRPVGPVLPLVEAVTIVNKNLALIRGTLRAVGSVDATVTLPKGGRRTLHLDGTLFYLEPRNLRFDLKHFGERQMLLGSNLTDYWVYDREDGRFQCWKHGSKAVLPEDAPIRPTQLIDALGLTPIPTATLAPDGGRRVQRIEGDVQQILFLDRDDEGQLALQKEYWVGRGEPRLVRRVVFRDGEGRLEMDSFLDQYAAPIAGGPMLPHLLTARWPREGTEIRFRVSRWTFEPSVTAQGIQYATPRECLGTSAASAFNNRSSP